MKRLIIIFCLLFLPLTARTQDGEITIIQKGERAPFDGLLLSQEAAAKVFSTNEKELKQCELDCGYKLDIQKLEAKLVSETLQLQLETEREMHLATITKYDNDIDALKNVKIEDDDDLMWASIGASAGVLVTSILFGVLWNVL
jgi:hypothetical protein